MCVYCVRPSRYPLPPPPSLFGSLTVVPWGHWPSVSISIGIFGEFWAIIVIDHLPVPEIFRNRLVQLHL